MKRKLEEETNRTVDNLNTQIKQAQHEIELLLRPFKEQITNGNAAIDDLKKDLKKCQLRFPLIPFLLLLLIYTIIVLMVFQEAKSSLVYIVGYGIFLIAVVIFEIHRLRLRRRAPLVARRIKKKQEALNEIILQQQKAEEQSEHTRTVSSLERTLDETKRKFKQDLARMG